MCGKLVIAVVCDIDLTKEDQRPGCQDFGIKLGEKPGRCIELLGALPRTQRSV